MSAEQSDDEGKGGTPFVRNWAERFAGPFRYRRFTGIGAGNTSCIFFEVEVPPGQAELATAVYEVFKGVKKMPRLSSGSGHQPTGLTFSREPTHGRVWRLPDNPLGRTAADVIQARLKVLAERIQNEQARGR